jgi:hypothetical protein
MTQGFTRVQTNRRTDILYGSTNSLDGGNRPETSVPIHQSTRRRMPEDNHRIKFIEFQDFWDVTMRCWAILDVSKCAGSRYTVFMQAIRSFKMSGRATMRRHVPITAPWQPYNWQDQVIFVENHQDATAYIALAGNVLTAGRCHWRHPLSLWGSL